MSWKRWLLMMQTIIFGMTGLTSLSFFTFLALSPIHGADKALYIAGGFMVATLVSFSLTAYHMGREEGFMQERLAVSLLHEASEEIANPIDGHDGGMLRADVLERINHFLGK